MISLLHRPLAVVALGATLLLAAACNSSGSDSDAAGAPAPAANTAEICKSGGEAARTAVLGLFGKLAEASSEAEMAEVYKTTFGTLRDDLAAHSAKATDPEFAAVLKEISAQADKIATASDPASAGTDGFESALGKLETYCPSGSPKSSAAPGGAAGGEVGAKGSACELPVTFSVAEDWEPTAIEVEAGDPLAELARKGPLTMACEIKGRDAGVTAFVRAWTSAKGTGARKALKGLMTGEKKTRKVTFTAVKIGGQKGVELRYQAYNDLLEEYSDRQAFAVPTPAGAVVVELSGLESDDPAAQEAYKLAKSTLAVRS